MGGGVGGSSPPYREVTSHSPPWHGGEWGERGHGGELEVHGGERRFMGGVGDHGGERPQWVGEVEVQAPADEVNDHL